MGINTKAYLLSILKSNPGEIFEILSSLLTTFKYRYIKRCIGKGTIVRSKTRIINSGNVRIADGCILQSDVYIRAGAQGSVVFRRGCMINSFARFFGHGGIELGEDTQIGPGVTITTTQHDYDEPGLPEIFSKVTLGKSVWVGASSTILPGISIGDNSVVGAGSVVTKDLPPNSIAAGVPAKIIKMRSP
jgi:acetyltransferase-like isoleucine patch superfamily enzyme